jgi:hypothetical protein
VNDDELTRSLADASVRRVHDIAPRPDVDELLTRIERRSNRQRSVLVASIATVLILGSFGGYLVGRSTDDGPARRTVVALSDGLPASPPSGDNYEPANVDAATAEIAGAFHSAYDGGVAESVRASAIQDGPSIEALTKASRASAERFGYTPEQLAGASISVLDTSFIDDTHAVVHFTLTIPGHGPILADRAGYAVLADGRWRVALRTACDLLSLSGLGSQCPSAP